MTDLTALNPLLEVLRLQAQALNAFAQQPTAKAHKQEGKSFPSARWLAWQEADAEMTCLKRLVEICERTPNASENLRLTAQQAQERISAIRDALKSRSPLPVEPSNPLFHTHTHLNSASQKGGEVQDASSTEFLATHELPNNGLAYRCQGERQ